MPQLSLGHSEGNHLVVFEILRGCKDRYRNPGDAHVTQIKAKVPHPAWLPPSRMPG